ncbi:MAG: crossover junction endodeoxyribonuclease RuvC [bacterium]
MIILGLDPGTAIVGWGVIDTGPRNDVSSAVCVAYDCILTDKGLSDSRRLVAIASGLEGLLKQYTPDLVSVEKLFFAKNQTTVMTVSQARGVLLLGIEQQGIPLVEFTPLQVKQALTGYGKADKSQIQNMVKLLLKLPGIPKPDDAADALAIAITAAQTQKY